MERPQVLVDLYVEKVFLLILIKQKIKRVIIDY